jgi:Tol biopolymer transport system component
MRKFILVTTLMLTLSFLLLITGMTLIGQGLTYKGEIRYFLQTLNRTTPYSMDAVRGLAYPLHLPFPASQVEWSHNNDYIIVWMGNATYLTEGNTTPLRLLSSNRVYPQWSPDGRHITFETFENSFGRIYLANGDGTDVIAITPDDTTDHGQPSFSPDSTQIAYVRGEDLYLLNLADNHVTQLTQTSEQVESTPYWSPDGQHIAFFWRETLNDNHLGVIDADGQNRHDFANEFDDVLAPYWSPDSTRVSFFVNGADGVEVWIADRVTGEVHRVATGYAQSTLNHGWSSDGENVIIGQFEQFDTMSFRLTLDQRDAETGELISHESNIGQYTVTGVPDATEVALPARDGHGVCIHDLTGDAVRCFPIYNGTPLNFRWLP